MLGALFLVLHVILGVSRCLALYKGYHAPFDVYMEVDRIAQDSNFQPPHRVMNICVGKEWYRFPSNFFLPDNWHLQFIPSEFKGQLPKPYANYPNATAIVPDHMNDWNGEEPSRYVNVKNCHYLVDLDVSEETPKEPRYSAKKDEWEVVSSVKFLDSARSPAVYRAFYFPWLTEDHCVYANYNLLKSKRTENSKPLKV